jgi:hypothetical protein
MAQNNAESFPIGRTALGGAACGFTYDGALQDAVAREDRLRRPMRFSRWQVAQRLTAGSDDREKKIAEPARSDLPV